MISAKIMPKKGTGEKTYFSYKQDNFFFLSFLKLNILL